MIFDLKPRSIVRRNGRSRWLYIQFLSLSAVIVAYGGIAAAEPFGDRKRPDIDWRTFLSGDEKPANPITPIPSEVTTRNAITTIPDQPRHKVSGDDGLDHRGGDNVKKNTTNASPSLGLSNVSKLRFDSGRIVVIPPSPSNVVNSVVNFSNVVDADSFGTAKSGGAALVVSPR